MIRSSFNLQFTAAIFLIMLISACDRNVVFEQNVKMDDNRWNVNQPVKLEADIQDTISQHNIYINVRNAGGYAFSNLFLFLTTTMPDGKTARDTVELTLADANGKWLGDGMGDIWDNRILFKRNFRFPMSGIYKFELQQAMRLNPLPQIMDAGIRIEKSDSK